MSDKQETSVEIAERLSIDVLPCRSLPGCGPRVDGGRNHSSSCRGSSRSAFVEAVAAAIEAAVGREREARALPVELETVKERLSAFLNAATDTNQFLNHSESHRQLVSNNWNTGSLRYERFTRIKQAFSETLEPAHNDVLILLSTAERLQADLAAAEARFKKENEEWASNYDKQVRHVRRLQNEVATAEQRGREAAINDFERWGMERDEPEVSYAARRIRYGNMSEAKEEKP